MDTHQSNGFHKMLHFFKLALYTSVNLFSKMGSVIIHMLSLLALTPHTYTYIGNGGNLSIQSSLLSCMAVISVNANSYM